MTPLSLLAAQKCVSLLTANNALTTLTASMGAAMDASLPPITSDQIILSSASPELGDRNMQFTYPRVCVYSTGLKNTQVEKFRTFSGQASVVADIWASADLVNQADSWIHIYVECVAELLRASGGDWGDGFFYPALYDVQFAAPKPGGLGFVESARISFTLGVSVA